MKKLLIASLVIAGCAENVERVIITAQDGISMGLDMSSVAPTCSNGGVTLKTFVDLNVNHILDQDEAVKKVSAVCNGINGQSVSVSIAGAACPNGGVVITSEATSIPICNGQDGSMGPQGQQGNSGVAGPQGAQGDTGQQGLIGAVGPQGPQGNAGLGKIIPVQLCPGDTATFKEYGLFIGADLFAVYFDFQKKETFLSKIFPGNYITTNGSDCQFTYANNTNNATLTNTNSSSLVTTVTF